jgi:hypothetical protein
MKMIVHETPSMELPAGFLAGFAEGGEEGAAVLIVTKDGLAPVAAIDEVVDGSGKLNAQGSGHRVGKLSRVGCHCQLLELTPSARAPANSDIEQLPQLG